MKKFIKITLSLVLTVILLATAMPIYAVEDDSIKEVEELREENVKHFEMPDGTFKAIVYSEPVHRKDADGKWQDIDNTLSSEKENGNTNYSSFDGRIKFSKNIKNANGKILELSENGYKISFSLIDENIKSASADVKNHKGKKTPTVFDSEREKLDKLQSVDNLTKISYNNIKKGIDIEYEIYANNIKESIIVNSKQSDYVYKFELKLNKLLAILNEDGSISLIDEKSGEEKYTMPAPFMFDDDGELSTDVYYTLTQNGKYKYELTVTADKEWINDSERNFPVTIDPTVDTVNSYYEEAYVSSSNPYSNYKKPSNGRLLVDSNNRTFLKFNLPTLSASATILDAVLEIRYYFSQSGSTEIEMYAVPYSWNENTITWNNSVVAHQTQENSVVSIASEYLSSGDGGTESNPSLMYFDMMNAVMNWYDYKDNNGIAIKCTSNSSQTVIFKGYNSGETLRPKMEVTYQESGNTFNGIYFARNAGSNSYMQNPYSRSDEVKLYPFDGDTNQKWKITYLRNGYYKITSLDGQYALTAPNNDGENVTYKEYNGSIKQMWSITKDAQENYTIKPRTNSTCYLATYPSSSPNIFPPAKILRYPASNTELWILYEVLNGAQLEGQQRSEWCWVTCARMLSSAFINVSLSQEQLAVSVKEGELISEPSTNQINNSNFTGSLEEVKLALNYIFGSASVYTAYGCFSAEVTQEILDDNNFIIALLYDTIQNKSHYVLIYGYRIVQLGQEEKIMLEIYDPLPMNSGSSYELLHDDLCNQYSGTYCEAIVMLQRDIHYDTNGF